MIVRFLISTVLRNGHLISLRSVFQPVGFFQSMPVLDPDPARVRPKRNGPSVVACRGYPIPSSTGIIGRFDAAFKRRDLSQPEQIAKIFHRDSLARCSATMQILSPQSIFDGRTSKYSPLCI